MTRKTAWFGLNIADRHVRDPPAIWWSSTTLRWIRSCQPWAWTVNAVSLFSAISRGLEVKGRIFEKNAPGLVKCFAEARVWERGTGIDCEVLKTRLDSIA